MASLRRLAWFGASAALVGILVTAASALAQDAKTDPLSPPATTWPPKGNPIKLPVTRDNWLSAMGEEEIGNNGGASGCKLKGVQEFTIFDVDTAPLKGKIVTGALWHFHCTSPKEPVLRVTVSSVASPWVEGTSAQYKPQDGSSCFAQAEYKKRDWAYPGSNFLDVAYGRGNTIWRFAEAAAPAPDGWQTAAVGADVVAARLAGLSQGFAAMDDVGSIWSYVNNKFIFTHFPNRFFSSREQNNAAPYLEVWTDGEDSTPPEPVADIKVSTEALPAGQAIVTWKTPADKGGGKTLGFMVTYKGDAGEKEMPRYLIPMAGAAGGEVKMPIQDLPLKGGSEITLTIRPVDSAGNVGQAFTKSIKVSDAPAKFAIAAAPDALKPFEPSEKLPQVGGLKVAVIDLLDKVEAKTGKMIPDHPAGYKGGNHLWSAEKKLIRLQTARNEHFAFQLNLEGKAAGVAVKLEFPGEDKLKSRIYVMDCVISKAGVVPDAAVAVSDAFDVPPKFDPQSADAANTSVLCEVYAPHELSPGAKTGKLTISAGGESLELAVELTVWDFTLPNKLSFVPEMNAYGTAGPTGVGLEYYRIAHEHRCCLNRLYYGWAGAGADGPAWKGDQFDWANWDKRYAPLLDGSAFADLPRKGEPVDVFYTPFNESWPFDVDKDGNFTKGYWPETSLSATYRQNLGKAFADWAKHCDAKGWHTTAFEFFLNGKVYYKDGGWGRCSAPWCLDEPANTQDFWALRWYGLVWRQAVDPVKGKAKMWYRSDVSRSNYDRDMFRDVMEMEVLGGANVQKIRMKRDEQALWTPTYYTEYGAANDPGDPNLQPVIWSLKSWTDGGVGVLPWQTIEGAGAWAKGEATCLFYSPRTDLPGVTGPVPSVRLKAFRAGQQLIEYLTLLGDTYNQPQWAVANGLADVVSLEGKVHKTSESDAGTIVFAKSDPTALWQLKVRTGSMISAKKPAYKPVLRPMDSPKFNSLGNLPPIGYAPVAPQVPPSKPE